MNKRHKIVFDFPIIALNLFREQKNPSMFISWMNFLIANRDLIPSFLGSDSGFRNPDLISGWLKHASRDLVNTSFVLWPATTITTVSILVQLKVHWFVDTLLSYLALIVNHPSISPSIEAVGGGLAVVVIEARCEVRLFCPRHKSIHNQEPCFDLLLLSSPIHILP